MLEHARGQEHPCSYARAAKVLKYSRTPLSRTPRFGPFRSVERKFRYSGARFGVKSPEKSGNFIRYSRGFNITGFVIAGCDCTRVAKMLEYALLVHNTSGERRSRRSKRTETAPPLIISLASALPFWSRSLPRPRSGRGGHLELRLL